MRAALIEVGSKPPNASAAPRSVKCLLNPPLVKSGNLFLSSLLSVFAAVDVLGTVAAMCRRNGALIGRPNLNQALSI